MNKYIVAVMPWGFEREVIANSEREAYKLVAAGLTDEQRDNLEIMDCVDEWALQPGGEGHSAHQ